MVERVRKQRHEHIGARQTADIFDKLSHQHHIHIGRRYPANAAAQGVEQKADDGYVLLAELFGERPYGEYAYTHGDAAEHGHERLRYPVRVLSQNIVAIIRKRNVFQLTCERIEQKISEQKQHIFIGENGFELQYKGYLFLLFAVGFGGDALLGEIVFEQHERQRYAREHAHAGYP